MPPDQLVPRWMIPVDIVATAAWCAWLWWSAKRSGAADPDRADGYMGLASRTIVWMVGMCLAFVVIELAFPEGAPSPLQGSIFSKPQVPWHLVLRGAIGVLVFARLTWWLFFESGFDTLVEYRRMFRYEFSVGDLKMLWGLAAVGCLASAVVPFFMR